MKTSWKTVFVIVGKNGKENEKHSIEDAKKTKRFLEEVTGETFTIKKRQKQIHIIEKGDKVKIVDLAHTGRIDIVTDIIKDAWGDTRYKTREVNGSKRGIAYRENLIPWEAER